MRTDVATSVLLETHWENAVTCRTRCFLRRVAGLALLAAIAVLPSRLDADLVVNAAAPITHQVSVQPIIVSNSDGTNTAEFFGTAVQETAIKAFVDTIWAQAGIDINWLTPNTWNDTFANIGTAGNNNPRPTSDLNTIVANGATAGVAHANPNVLNIYFVEIAAGFGDTNEFTANGLAFVGANGISQHIGDSLPTFVDGQEVAASVVAHEIGHNLGLPHIVEAENLMQAGGSPNPGERLNASQITTALASSFSVAVPEPSHVFLLIAGLVGVAVYVRRQRVTKAAL